MNLRNLNLWKILVLIIAAGSFAGCARIRQYSIESYQGPFPIHDREYLALTDGK